MARPRVLVAEDEDRILDLLRGILSERFDVVTAADGHRALELGLASDFDVVISDLRVPGLDALALLRELKRAKPDLEVVILTANGTSQRAVQAMKHGAYDYLREPFEPDEALLTIERALERKSLRERARRSSAFGMDDFGGKCAAMQHAAEQLAWASASDATVLITGEPGTGKELAARTVHMGSARSTGPFVPVACAAIPEHAIESELFGHARGAFAGADADRRGLFEEAQGGTLYLDEVEALPLPTQEKLSRALQEHAVRRVGEAFERRVSTRVIAATHTELDAAVEVGRFRAELLYQLRVLPIYMPPLRERSSDIPELALSFLERHASDHRRRVEGFTPEALSALLQYPWPGNIRQLENAIERALAVSDGPRIAREALPEEVAFHGSSRLAAELCHLGYREAVSIARDRASREYLVALMREQGGSVTRAAERAGMERETLHRLLKRFGLHSEDFRRR